VCAAAAAGAAAAGVLAQADVVQLVASNKEKRQAEWQAKRVFFCTPQVLACTAATPGALHSRQPRAAHGLFSFACGCAAEEQNHAPAGSTAVSHA